MGTIEKTKGATPEAPTLNKSGGGAALKRLFAFRESALLVVIVFVFILMTILSPYFLTSQMMLNILMSLTLEGVIAIGMTILLVSGGMDLSAGYNMALAGVVSGLLFNAGLPLPVAVLLGLLCGLGVGISNGLLIAFLGLNPFICTLGMSMTLNGLMLIVAQGRAVIVSGSFYILGQNTLFGIPYPVIILVALTIFFDILLRRSRTLRQSYYVGGNENAAKLNGINVRGVKVFNYAITGLLSALAGIIFASRLSTAPITLGGDTALNVLTACIIGGASLRGGEGSILGGFLGVVFIQLLSSSFNIMDVNTFVKTFVTGLILIGAITIDVLNENRKVTRLAIDAQRKMNG